MNASWVASAARSGSRTMSAGQGVQPRVVAAVTSAANASWSPRIARLDVVRRSSSSASHLPARAVRASPSTRARCSSPRRRRRIATPARAWMISRPATHRGCHGGTPGVIGAVVIRAGHSIGVHHEDRAIGRAERPGDRAGTRCFLPSGDHAGPQSLPARARTRIVRPLRQPLSCCGLAAVGVHDPDARRCEAACRWHRRSSSRPGSSRRTWSLGSAPVVSACGVAARSAFMTQTCSLMPVSVAGRRRPAWRNTIFVPSGRPRSGGRWRSPPRRSRSS